MITKKMKDTLRLMPVVPFSSEGEKMQQVKMQQAKMQQAKMQQAKMQQVREWGIARIARMEGERNHQKEIWMEMMMIECDVLL